MKTSDECSCFKKESGVRDTVRNCVGFDWSPFPGVIVTTCVTASGPWSIRLHRLKAEIHISIAEDGFPLSSIEKGLSDDQIPEVGELGEAFWKTELGFSGIRDIGGLRRGRVVVESSESNALFDKALVPRLSADFPPGEHWLGSAVLAHPDPGEGEEFWNRPADFDRVFDCLRRSIEMRHAPRRGKRR